MEMATKNIVSLISEAKKQGVDLLLENERLVMRMPKGYQVPQSLLSELRLRKEELRHMMQSGLIPANPVNTVTAAAKIQSGANRSKSPLSSAQKRLWFINKMEQEVNYHIPVILQIKGVLDKIVLEAAFKRLLQRHEILRTVYHDEAGVPYQTVCGEESWMLQSYLLPIVNEQTVQDLIRREIHRPFQLDRDYMLRAGVCSLSEDEHLLITVVHHIAADGWSMPILMADLAALYRQGVGQSSTRLAPLPVQYIDFAAWQNERIGNMEESLEYWVKHLSGHEPLQLPTDFKRPAELSRKGKTLNFAVPKELVEAVKKFSNQQGTTFFMTLLSAFQVLLHKYTGQQDICVGCGIANRTQSELEKLVGFFVNTLAIRNHLVGNPSFTQIVEQVKTITLDAFQHQDVPFEAVVERVAKVRDISRDSVIQVLFMVQNTPQEQMPNWGQLTVQELEFDYETSKFDLTLHVYDKADKVTLAFEYCTELFAEATITRMKDHFLTILAAVIESPNTNLSDINMLTKEEQQKVLYTFNESVSLNKTEDSLIDMFEAQAIANPDKIAIVIGKDSYTYENLYKKVQLLSQHLCIAGIAEGDVVAICAERSVGMIVSLLATCKLGAAYLPIDLTYPDKRICEIFQESSVKWALADDAFITRFDFTDVSVIHIENTLAQPLEIASTSKRIQSLDNPCYVIYTSGSTGKPKGVVMPQSALLNLLQWQQHNFTNKNRRTVLQFTSLGFDVSFQEIFSTLCYGNTLVLIDDDSRKDPYRLLKIMEERSITHLFLPFIVLDTLAETAVESDSFPVCLEEIITAGEQLRLTNNLKQFVRKCGAKLVNQYGPTESHVVSSYTVTAQDLDNIILPPIGKPISNTQLYILDAYNNPTGIGIQGELYIAGKALAKGYYRRQNLTDQRFVTIAINGVNSVVYKTGDLVKWLPDGNIAYIGRNDDQVKIRGNRVELGEVEAVIMKCAGVTACTILVKKDNSNNNILVAYLVTEGNFSQTQLEVFIQEMLPAYMIPAAYVFLDKMPVNINGKVDKKLLPEPVFESDKDLYTAPSTAEEIDMATLWRTLLKVEQVGLKDNFFALGGHSLLATRLVAAIRSTFEVEIAVKEIFRNPVLQDLVKYVTSVSPSQYQVAFNAIQEKPAQVPLSFSQERLWFLDKFQGTTNYHIWNVWNIKGRVAHWALEKAVKGLMERHEALRTVFVETDNNAYQSVIDASAWNLAITHVTENEAETMLEALVAEAVSRPFDLQSDYMLRAHLITLSEDNHVVIFVFHHIATDGWSATIFLNELKESYAKIIIKEPVQLTTLAAQYSDYAIWQRQFIQSKDFLTGVTYWENKLNGIKPLNFPKDKTAQSSSQRAGKMYTLRLSAERKQEVQQLAEASGVTAFMVYLAAFHVLLYRYTGQGDTCIGVPVSNRKYAAFESLIGFFVNNLPMRCQLNGSMTFEDILANVKTTALEAYEHQDVPFEKMVERLVHTRDMGQNPIFQVTLTYHSHVVPDCFELGDAIATVRPVEINFTLFDLSFHITESEAGVLVGINYSTACFHHETIQRLAANFEVLLSAMVRDTKQPVFAQPLLTEAEKYSLQLVAQGVPLDVGKSTFLTLFAQMVQMYPTAIALVDGDKVLTYEELNRKAARVANFLVSKGVKSDEVVAICMPRSLEMVVSVLGIWKAGAAYMPIDPSYPAGRINFMVDNAGVTTALVFAQFNRDTLMLESPIADRTGLLQIQLDELEDVMTHDDGLDIWPHTINDGVAYVIYTSGSTGTPKGVVVSHSSLNNLIQWHQQVYTVNGEAKASVLAGVGFDAAVWEVWPYLASGATICIVPEETKMDPHQLLKWYGVNGITHSFVPTALLPSVVQVSKEAPCKSLQFVLTGGDELHTIDMQGIRYRIFNNYGPTENTVVATCYELTGNEIGNPPIGKPIANTTIHLVDSNNQFVPYGSIGEICIAGLSLASGYLNNELLTQEKFCNLPQDGSKKFYKTGDLGRWLPDGNLEFLGRVDNQVQIRGYRVELGEISHQLNTYPGIAQSFVSTYTNQIGAQALVGYVCGDVQLDDKDIKAFLKQSLPGYMIPEVIMVIDRFPLSPNGKIDKDVLPLPSVEVQEYTPPRNEIEKQLFEIWKDLLNSDKIGIHDDFFALGGDSIVTIQVVSRAKRLGYSLQAKDIFEYKTIAELATVVGKADKQHHSEQGVLTGSVPLSPIQHWFFEHVNQDIHHYNQALLFKLDKSVSVSLLQAAIEQLAIHHDSLRLRYNNQNGVWHQFYSESTNLLAVEDLQQSHPEGIPDNVTEICHRYQQRLNIEHGPIFYPVLMLMPTTDTHNRLFLCIHHLAVDGVSWRIIVDDLKQLLSICHQRVDCLGQKTSSYRAFAESLIAYSTSEVALRQIPFWKEQVTNQIPLPVDMTSDKSSWKNVKDCRIVTSKNLTHKLLTEVHGAFNTTINDILLAAFYFTIQQWSGNNRLLIGMEGHGREDVAENLDTTNTVGWFTNIYPLHVSLDKDDSIERVVKIVKEAVRSIPNKGIAYAALRYLHPSQEIRKVLLTEWEILFNYLGQFDNAMGAEGLISLANESTGQGFGDEIPFNNRFMINCIITDGALDITWSYSEKDYHETTVHNLLNSYVRNLEVFAEHCVGKNNLLTPSDCGLAGKVSIEALDRFLDEQQGAIPRRELIASIYPLSPMQEGLLFHGLFNKKSTAYTEQVVCDINASVDLAAFQQTWALLVQHHSVLRTSFHHSELAVPVQCEYKEINMPFRYMDFSQHDKRIQQQEIDRFLQEDKEKGFDFVTPPLSRVALIKLADTSFKMIWTHHHILLDGWSFSILTGKLLSYYEALVTGKFPSEEFKDDYRSLINYLQSKDRYEEELFWKDYSKDFATATMLPFTDAPVMDRNKDAGVVREIAFSFGRVTTNKITEYCRNLGITVNTLIQGVWAKLLAAYTANEVVAFGVTTSGRPAEIAFADKRVGLYINTIPLFANTSGNQKIGEWLKEVQSEHMRAREYQYTPLSRIQQWTSVTGELFDTLLVFENYPINERVKKKWSLQLGELQLEEHTNYLLTVIAYMLDELHVKFSYNADLLDSMYVDAIKTHFENLLLQMVGVSKGHEGGFLDSQEKALLEQYGKGSVEYFGNETIVDRIASLVTEQPHATALNFGDTVVTYKSLDTASDLMATRLCGMGIEKGQVVALYLDRSIDFVVAALAILKVGAVYMPMDTAYPDERIRYMLADANAKIIVSTQQQILAKSVILNDLDIPILRVDEDTATPNEIVSQHFERPTPKDTAYIIYTSGSTGRPKGVKISHGALHNLVSWHIKTFDVGDSSKGSLMASVAFDGSVWELWPYLCVGATVCLITDDEKIDPVLLLQQLRKYGVTHCFLPTALLLTFIEQARHESLSLKYLLTGGERLGKVDLTGINFRLVNNYGPTENTVVSAYYEVTGRELQDPPIGKPIANTIIRLLDKSLQLVPVGAIGEIYLSGNSLSDGYLNHEDLNQDKFIDYSVVEGESEKIYRTGDLGRWLPDGNLSFLGRVDQQVKFRGYRIEPGEIEHALLQISVVKECFVSVVATSDEMKQLLAFVVLKDKVDTASIVSELSRHLPTHMIPNVVIAIDSLPLTTGGKIDVEKLKELAVAEYARKNIMLPRNPTEQLLLDIWKSLLSNEMIGITDDFFALGGNSLLVIRMVAAIKQEAGVLLSVKSVFEYPRIIDLAAFIQLTNNHVQQGSDVHIFEL